MKKILLLSLLSFLFLQLNCFAYIRFADSSSDQIYSKKIEVKRAISVLNQAIIFDYGLNKRMITNTADFRPMFLNRLFVNPEKTTNDSFTTWTGDKYTIVPLHPSCNPTTGLTKLDIRTACAKVIVQPKAINQRFELLLYPDGVFAQTNSELYNLLNGN